MTLSLRGALFLSSSLITASMAIAQDAEDGEFLGEIRIDSAPAQTLLGNQEITSEDIERRNPATMRDVFNGETSVTGSGGASIAQKVYVNGIEDSLLSVTIDGARQNKSAFHHAGNVLIDPGLLEAVNVTSGLAPADAGPGGLGGSIAYKTKDVADLLEEGDNFGGYLRLGGGTNGYGMRGNLVVYGREGGFEYLLSGTRHDGSDYKDGDGVTVEGTEPKISDYMAKIAYTTQNGHRFAFSASQTEDKGQRAAQRGPGGLLFARPDFAGLTTGPNTLIEAPSKRTSYAFTYTNLNTTEWFDPTIQFAYNKQEMDVGGVSGENISFSGTASNVFSLANGTVTAGLDFFNDTAEGWTAAPFNFTGKEKLQNIGIFAQARQDLGSRVSVSYGARYDWQEFTGADGSVFKDAGFSANGTVDVVLTNTLTLNAGVASTWGGYELGEAALINFFTPWNYNGFTASRSNSGRIGLRFDNGTWTARGAIFRTDIDDIAAVLPRGGNRGATTDVTSQGFDGSLGYLWDSGFVRLNYTYADVQSSGAPIGSTAYYLGSPVGHQFAVETAWQPSLDWLVGGTFRYAPEFTDVNTATSTTLDSYSVLDVYAEYVPPNMDNVTLRLDVRNLFDETYVARGADGAGSIGRPIPLNEPGRTITLFATVRF